MHKYLNAFPGRRIAVIGDVMLDCYMSGDVSRISPEAPVPVLRVAAERAVPGGAANVAANLVSLGIRVNLVGLAGQDESRDEMIACLQAEGEVNCAGVLAIPGRRTTRKLRIIGAHQQIVRVDHEDEWPCDLTVDRSLVDAAVAAAYGADLIIISDYGKGTCSDAVLRAVFDHAATAGKKVLVDPKRQDLSGYRGATLLTPNRKELSLATRLPCDSDEDAERAAAAARATCGADILLTRSERGMSFFPAAGAPIHLPTVAQDVFDVSGAGDTVSAVLGIALAADVPMIEAMRLANHAAGIVVSKVGTATVTRQELDTALLVENGEDVCDGRLLSLEEAVSLRWFWAAQKLTVGFTNGCFDLVHPGHVALLRRAAQNCDRLIVALNSDDSVRRLKGSGRPVQNEQSRAEVIGAIKGVAAVILFTEDTPLEQIKALQPDLLVKGSDYSIDQVVGAQVVLKRSGRVLLFDLQDGHSTTAIISALIKR